ncbi:hypothetical protein M758_7G114800 [Ceratodon purpureus]|nr:hypothetical protein M758_7G114800 [Ceratodon purpureus]
MNLQAELLFSVAAAGALCANTRKGYSAQGFSVESVVDSRQHLMVFCSQRSRMQSHAEATFQKLLLLTRFG